MVVVPYRIPYPPTLGGVLDGFSNGDLFFPALQPRNAGAGGVSRARFPPGPHLRGSRFSRLPPLRLPPTRRLFQNDEIGAFSSLERGPQGPGGPGPTAPSPGPQCFGKPRRLDHLFRLVARLISFRQATPS